MTAMLRLSLLTACAVLVAILMGCASSESTSTDTTGPDGVPRWVEDPAQTHDTRRYLLASGSGTNTQQAQEQALSNLARMFEATIDASRRTVDNYEEITRDGGIAETEGTVRMLDLTNIRSEQDLLNTEVLAQQQADDGTHYALVGMHRTRTLAIYTERIETNRAQIETYVEAGETRTDPIEKLAAYRRALVLSQVNETLQEQRSIIAGGGGVPNLGDGTTPERTELEEAFTEAQRACPILVEGSTVPDAIHTQAAQSIEAAGFPTTRSPDDAILRAEVKYHQEPTLETRDDASFLYWTLDITVVDVQRNQTRGTFSADNRSGGLSATQAQQAAHRDARHALDTDLAQFLTDTLLRIDLD